MINLVEQAKKDILAITSNASSGFGQSITITTPDGVISASINGLSTKHHIGMDSDGALMNVKNAHISFSEQLLTNVSYPVRNINGEVQLRGHKITTKDSTGVEKNYIINENFPDETVGFIVCILGDYADSTTDENQPSYIFKCDDATVKNSNDTFSLNIASGLIEVLSDIIHTDSDGTFVTLPAQTPMVCTPNQALNISNFNDSYSVNTLVDLDLPNIDFTNSDGTTTSVPSMENISATPCVIPLGVATPRIMFSGQLVSYRTGDDRWQQDNNPPQPQPLQPLYFQELVDYYTLKYDNPFGNRLRFTDSSGNFTVSDDPTVAPDLTPRYIVDNLYERGIGLQAIYSSNNINWNNSIDACNSLVSEGYDDWYLPNVNEWGSMLNYRGSFYSLMITYYGGNRDFWLSTTTNYNTSYAYFSFITAVYGADTLNSKIKTSNTGNYLPIRKHIY